MAHWCWHLPAFTATILWARTLCSSLPFNINIKQLKQPYASSAVLMAEQKGQEIIIVQTFLKKGHFNTELHQSL